MTPEVLCGFCHTLVFLDEESQHYSGHKPDCQFVRPGNSFQEETVFTWNVKEARACLTLMDRAIDQIDRANVDKALWPPGLQTLAFASHKLESALYKADLMENL